MICFWPSFSLLLQYLIFYLVLSLAVTPFVYCQDGTTVVTVTTILTPTVFGTLDGRQNCPVGEPSLDFCSDVQLSWMGSTHYSSMNGTTGTGASSGGPPSSTTSGASPTASSQYQDIIDGSAFQLYLAFPNGAVYYIKIGNGGYVYLIIAAAGQLFRWEDSSVVTFEPRERTLFALPDSLLSSLRPRQNDGNSVSSSHGSIKVGRIVPEGAFTNFTFIPRGNVVELVLFISGQTALFGTGPGCSSDFRAPSNGLAFNLEDNFDSLPNCQQVILTAAVAGNSPVIPSSSIVTSTSSGGGSISSGSSSSTSSRRRTRTRSRSTTTSRPESPSSTRPSSTRTGITTGSETSSSRSASPGSTGPSSPSDTSQPCSGTSCSASDTETPSPACTAASCTVECLATAQIPASLSCPNDVANDYVTVDRRVYSLCTGYSLVGLSGVAANSQGGPESTLSLLQCLESCAEAGCTGMAFKIEQNYRPVQTWSCLFETDSPQSYVTGNATTYVESEYTAAVYICSNTFDDTIEPPNPTRNTILIPEVPCERAEPIPTARFCPYNTATGTDSYQQFTTFDSTVYTLCPEGQYTGVAPDPNLFSSATTLPLPFTLTDCLTQCTSSSSPDPCNGILFVVNTEQPPVVTNGYSVVCLMLTDSSESFTTSVFGGLNHVLALREICTNTFAYTGCAEDLVATPATAACCQGRQGYLYTTGSSVFNVCPGCFWPSSGLMTPQSTGTANAIFIDDCLSSCTDCTAIGVLSFSTSAPGGRSLTYACNSPTVAGLEMTDASPVNGFVEFPTAAAFLCTNSWSADPSPPITSPVTPTFAFCEPTFSTVTGQLIPRTVWYTSVLGGVSLTWGGIQPGGFVDATMQTSGCFAACTDPLTPASGRYIESCASLARGAASSAFEVIRFDQNDGMCVCRYYDPIIQYTATEFITAPNVLEVYAYSTTS
ncbi:hypothetical protein Dda_8072 [Drechslerella dactyloides]|uniref:Apple domain-containing protein n=1 Tax=Drechslerella dactyloides TaxID=74499 RepID=A0AAD6NF71_DREDA|nr:hypothetical protein Dda_8072 [Drechslerella dactyloides]